MPNYMIVYLLGILLLLVLLLTGFLAFLLGRSNRVTTVTLLNLLKSQQTENQSLRNQLRSGDPMTLHSLQYATGNSPSDEGYTPTYDEGLTYQQNLQGSEYKNLGLPDDLHAAGWDPVATRDDGGTPVNFAGS